jgi:hypothetical protein
MGFDRVKISSWGLQIDVPVLIAFAALTFVGWNINSMAIPVAPSLWMKFGGVVLRFVSVCGGPMWYALALFFPGPFGGIVNPIYFPDLIFAVIPSGILVSIFDKYVPPLLGVYPSLPGLLLSYFIHFYYAGYPLVLALQLLLKNIANTLIITLFFTLLIALPYINEILPLRYDSWVARYWLIKMEGTYSEGATSE